MSYRHEVNQGNNSKRYRDLSCLKGKDSEILKQEARNLRARVKEEKQVNALGSLICWLIIMEGFVGAFVRFFEESQLLVLHLQFDLV